MFNINLTDDTVLRQMGELNKCNKELLEINNDLLKKMEEMNQELIRINNDLNEIRDKLDKKPWYKRIFCFFFN